MEPQADHSPLAPPPETAPEPTPEAAPETLSVALDVRTWGMSGLGTWLAEYLAALGRIEAPIRWTMIGHSEVREQLPAGIEAERWIELRAPIYDVGAMLRYPHPGPVDLWHYTHYNLPPRPARAAVVNVFDLFHRRYGSFMKRRYMNFFLRRLRWSRAHIMTGSEKVRRELIEQAHLRPGRVHLIHPGPGRRRPAERPSPVQPVALSGRPLAGPWLLAVGIDQPHKNFDFLLSALSLYYHRRPDAPPLVWTGLRPEGLERRARLLPAWLRPRVALEVYESSERVEGLLAGAAALVFPSLDEGFGLPPLEAMARSVPVLCARREPMTQILGDAPLYFEPSESDSLWRVIDRLLDSDSIRPEMIRRGLIQAARYDWDATARQMVELYRLAAGRAAPSVKE